MNEVNAPVKRKVGFFLWVGIFFLPIVFAWFLLRKGHSALSRVLGFAWLIIGVLIILAAPSTPTSNRIASSQAPTSSAQSAPIEPLKAYTASQVSASYDENTVAADILFKGNRVKVSGRITDINTDAWGNPYLVLAGTNQFMGPQFKFDKSDVSVMASLKKGTAVTVICTGKGDVIKTPMFGDCEMTK